MKLKSINPATGEIINEYTSHSKQIIETKINETHHSWLLYKQTSFKERATYLKKLGKLLEQNKTEIAALITAEMGKPIKQGIAEIEKCTAVCEYYSKNGAGFLADELVETDASKSFISYQPIGIVLAIMPWNFPFWQVLRFLAPALMAGNAGLLKHAGNVCGCALFIEKLVREAGFPDKIFQTLLLPSKKVSSVIEHPFVKAVTITGSTAAGKKVAEKAGSLLKKTVLELGGSDPYIILKDADLEQAAETCVNSRLINGGQSCIAAKRFIVVDEVYNDFLALFISKMQQKKMGDPTLEDTDVGPQARTDLRDELHKQVTKSVKMGAKCVLGGLPGDFAFYPPTILTDVKKGMPAYDEELFGPVAAIISARNEDEAIEIANDSVFGLGAAVFTKDLKKGEYIASKLLNAGSCFVNELVKSDPRLPFGGINQSGYGRELGYLGIREFVNIKTVYIK